MIRFAPSVRGAINLKSELPKLQDELWLRGPGATKLTVRRSFARGTPEFRVFAIEPRSTITISGLRISNGGIFNHASRLTIRGSILSGNKMNVYHGGGIFNRGIVLIQGSVLSNNYARRGGAISGGRLRVMNTTFSNNRAAADGAAIFNGSKSTITNSTFSGNRATRLGGGIYNLGEMRVRNSTFSKNSGVSGGGISNVSGHYSPSTMTVMGSTFSGNEATRFGGGIFNSNDLTVGDSTFSGNSAGVEGGGIRHKDTDFSITSLQTTIVAENDAPTGPDASGPFSSGGYNLIGNTSGSSGFGPTDLQNIEPGLDPQGLQDNGGRTWTIALVEGSPAIDAVQEGCPPPATDQRGVKRPQDGDGDGTARCDIGAFERR